MWSFPTQFLTGTDSTSSTPKHFTFLILYIFTTSVLVCHFILPVTLSTDDEIQFQIQTVPQVSSRRHSRQILNSEIQNSSKNERVEPRLSEIRREEAKRKASSENVSRRSDSTQVRLGGEENRLFYHWIPDMKGIWDERKEVYWPWPNSSPDCQQFNVHFALENTWKPKALVSYPGSGNSWLRYLLESTTGIFTGSIFKDKSLYAAGLLGEFNHPINNGRTIVQKTHHDSATGLRPPKFKSEAYKRKVDGMVRISELVFGYRGILLVRNPFDAMLSYWNYVHTKNHKAHAPMDFNFVHFVKRGVEEWAGLIQTWVKKSSDLLLVQYEDLLEDPRKELMRILNYLRVPVEEARLSCTLKFLEGPFRRRPSEKDQESRAMEILEGQGLIRIIQHHVNKTNQVLGRHFLPQLLYTFGNPRVRASYPAKSLP